MTEEEKRIKHREYSKKWYANNKEKAKEYQKKYRKEHAAELRDYHRAYRRNNPLLVEQWRRNATAAAYFKMMAEAEEQNKE